LHGALVLPADNERDAGILYNILMLARLGHGIEQKFSAVRDGDADHCRLGAPWGVTLASHNSTRIPKTFPKF
jgi:hypothetical protein